jgi:hypothetical protein
MGNPRRDRTISKEKLSRLSMQPMPYIQRVNGVKGRSTRRENIKEKARQQDPEVIPAMNQM